jgi:hypothetical protein
MLTRVETEHDLEIHAIKSTAWDEILGFHIRIYQMPAGYDCSDLPPEFEVIMEIGDTCVVREQIDELEGADFWPKYQRPDQTK